MSKDHSAPWTLDEGNRLLCIVCCRLIQTYLLGRFKAYLKVSGFGPCSEVAACYQTCHFLLQEDFDHHLDLVLLFQFSSYLLHLLRSLNLDLNHFHPKLYSSLLFPWFIQDLRQGDPITVLNHFPVKVELTYRYGSDWRQCLQFHSR